MTTMPSKEETTSQALARRCLALVARWVGHAESAWYDLPGRPGLGCYGTGYNAWGVQTNQKYLAALAALAALGESAAGVPAAQADQARARALAALRFSLWSHRSGGGACTDGTAWGHTWISALGVERMMFGVRLLEPAMTEEDLAGLRRMLISEADWICDRHARGKGQGVFGDRWNASGLNAPESNLWNGALLWRTAVMYPDEPRAGDWREKAHAFLINSVSVPQDALDSRLVAGRPVKERHVGANFFPNYALDHHGYLNVGYMVICLSNAAMLHFDLKSAGLPAPESLYHHQADLWRVVRRMVFEHGRLARLGGDTRLRYTYCQEYLLPTLLYAADALGDEHALALFEAQLDWIEQEAAGNPDGSFYGARLAALAANSPYYYTRLESDRACVLAMAAAHLQRLPEWPAPDRAAAAAFEASVAGAWCEPEHGAVLHRSPTRLVSFAWRAHGLAQGLCLPPDQDHLAEWSHNLAGRVRFLGDSDNAAAHRELVRHEIAEFPGGFATSGELIEGNHLVIPEGTRLERAGRFQLAFAALPDGHTVVGLQQIRAGNLRVYVKEIKGLHLNVPNDLFNGGRRRLDTARGPLDLAGPPARDEVLDTGSAWLSIEGQIGVAALYGAPSLVVDRSAGRRGGAYESLYVEEICLGHFRGMRCADPGELLLDAGWAVMTRAGAERAARFLARAVAVAGPDQGPDLRVVFVEGLDERRYLVAANFGADERAVPAESLNTGSSAWRDLVTGERTALKPGVFLEVRPGAVRVFEVTVGT
jgi:hypothetical protein